MTPDPIGISGGLNLYSYAGQNPINYIDPYGLEKSRFGQHWWERLAEGYYYGTGYGEEAVDFYAGVIADPDAPWWAKGAAYIGGTVATLWTKDMWMITAGSMAGAGLAQTCGLTSLGPNVYWKGGEVVISNSSGRPIFRGNPFGNPDSKNPFGRRPHYHRRPGIDKHRPWERGW